jgi:hypothetical protein
MVNEVLITVKSGKLLMFDSKLLVKVVKSWEGSFTIIHVNIIDPKVSAVTISLSRADSGIPAAYIKADISWFKLIKALAKFV